ncbi:MAG: hypothetical protein EHM20_03260, partial [Alphaproteobacteria bacterium]
MEKIKQIVEDIEYLRKPSYQVDVLTITEEQHNSLKEMVKEMDSLLIVDKNLKDVKSVKGYGLSACQLESVKAKGQAPRLCCIRIPCKNPLVLN